MSKVVFLDRDGVINVDHRFVGTLDKWEWIPGSIGAMKQLQDAGFELTVVTNQSGIGLDYYTLEDMHALHEMMEVELAKTGVKLAHIAYCAHAPEDECNCRKPALGMVRQIEEVIGPINYTNSWTIGDKEKDVLLGQAAGTKTALIPSEYWNEENLKVKPDMIVASLAEFANAIVGSKS